MSDKLLIYYHACTSRQKVGMTPRDDDLHEWIELRVAIIPYCRQLNMKIAERLHSNTQSGDRSANISGSIAA